MNSGKLVVYIAMMISCVAIGVTLTKLPIAYAVALILSTLLNTACVYVLSVQKNNNNDVKG